MNQSIADDFIEVMAALRAINPDNDEPMRHSMQMLKSEGEQIISEALRRARHIAYHARLIQKDAASAVKDAVAAAASTNNEESK